jgi:hypothetical protein
MAMVLDIFILIAEVEFRGSRGWQIAPMEQKISFVIDNLLQLDESGESVVSKLYLFNED